MRQIRFEIAGVPNYSLFSNEDNATVPLLDVSTIGESFTFDRPLASSTEVSFVVPRFVGAVDLYQLYGPVTHQECATYAELKTSMHKGDTTLVLKSSLVNPSGYIHIKTECMAVSGSTLAANTNYTVTRGALGTRILPFLVSDAVTDRVYVTNQPCYWKGRMFTIYLKEGSSWVVWYRGLLTQNPVMTDNRIQFSGVLLENIISGDLYNSLDAIKTTLSPIVKIGRKVPGYLAARSSIDLYRLRLEDNTTPQNETNYFDGTATLIASSPVSGNVREHLRNICAAPEGVKTTTENIPIELGTTLGSFYGTVSYAIYNSHMFGLFINCETVSSDVSVNETVTAKLPAVCGVYTAPLSANNVVKVDTIDLPSFQDLSYQSPALTSEGQIEYGHYEIVQLEKSYQLATDNKLVLHKIASTPYTYKIKKHVGFLRRFHTKDVPNKADYDSVKKSFALRDWQWNSDHKPKDFFSLDGSTRFLSYPFKPITPQKVDDDLLDDVSVFISNAGENIQQELDWYSLRVHTDGRDGETLRAGSQRRNIDIMRAEAFWEKGMDYLFLKHDIATPPNGRWFEVKWTEIGNGNDTVDLKGRIKLKRDSLHDFNYTDDQGATVTGFAYHVIDAKYNRKTPLIAFGTWPTTKDCILTPIPTVESSSHLVMKLLCSCEGNCYNDYDILPVGYNIDPSLIEIPLVMAENSIFPEANFTGPATDGANVAEEFITAYLLTSVSGLIGKHIYNSTSGWNYKISRVDLFPEQHDFKGAKATFNDSDIVSIPSITRSEDVYSGYKFNFEAGDDKFNVSLNDKTASYEFGANNILTLNMKHFNWNLDEDPSPRCAALVQTLHPVLGYAQKELSVQVPFDKAAFLNLGDHVRITSDYLDNDPFWSSRTYDGRLVSITHDIKAGISSIVVRGTPSTASGWGLSLEMLFDPYYYQQQMGLSGGLGTWAQFLSTNNATMTFYFDNNPANPFNGGSLNLDNYTNNAKCIDSVYRFGDMKCTHCTVWLDGFNLGAECSVTNLSSNGSVLMLALTNVGPYNAANQPHIVDYTIPGYVHRLRFMLNDNLEMFRTDSGNESEVDL